MSGIFAEGSIAEVLQLTPAVVEFRKVHGVVVPFSARLWNGKSYEFEWCHRDQELYWLEEGRGDPKSYSLSKFCWSGSWTEAERRLIFAADGVDLLDDGGRVADLAALGYRRTPSWFDLWPDLFSGRETRTDECPVCDDRFPVGEHWDPCEHLWLQEDAEYARDPPAFSRVSDGARVTVLHVEDDARMTVRYRYLESGRRCSLSMAAFVKRMTPER